MAWSLLLIGESVGRLILIAVLPVDDMLGLSKMLQVVLVLSFVGFAGGYAERTGLGMRASADSLATPEDRKRSSEAARGGCKLQKL